MYSIKSFSLCEIGMYLNIESVAILSVDCFFFQSF